MREFWLKLLGYDVADLPESATTEFVLTHAPRSWLVFVLIALLVILVWGVIYLYRRENPACPRWVRHVLAGNRALVLMLLIFVLLGPSLVVSTQRVIEPYVVLLVDRSLSMSLVDRSSDAPADSDAAPAPAEPPASTNAHSRLALAQQLLARDDYNTLEQLRKVNHLKVISFDSATQDIDTFALRRTEQSVEQMQTERTARTLPYDLVWWLGAPALGLCVLMVWWFGGRPFAMTGAIAGIVVLFIVAGVVINNAFASRAQAEPPEITEEPTEPDESDKPITLPTLAQEGSGILSTDLAGAIREALTVQSRNPLAGIVILTDGQATAGDDPLAVAEQAGQQGVPIYPVGIGDPTEPRNLRVAELWTPESVFTNNPLQIQSRLQINGCEGQTVRLELIERAIGNDGSAGGETTIATRDVTVVGDPATIEGDPATFFHTPTRAGNYLYTLRLAELPNELVTADNARSNRVRVLSDMARVLLISGGPTWEYRNLARLLIRDKTTDVSCWLQSMDQDMRQEGNTLIDKLPREPRELFKYDLIIMLDPDPRDFDQAWLENLERFLDEHAGGLLYMAGPKHTARFMTHFTTRAIADLLPIRLGQLSAVDVESLETTHTRDWPMRLTSLGVDHPVLQLADDSQSNKALWPTMPGVYWSFPLRGAKPASKVIIEHSDPRLRRSEGARPLMVSGQFGPGRSLYIGFSGTWRWRRVGEQYFDRFWIKAVRHLIEGRLLGGRKRGRIETDRDVYEVGDRIVVRARLYDPAFKPLVEPQIEAQVRQASGQTLPLALKPVANRPGYYQGAYGASGAGVHEIALTLAGAAEAPVRVARQITVQVPQAEFADPRLDRATLNAIAERSNGRLLKPAEFNRLPQLITDKTEILIEPAKPAGLWDTDRLLIILLMLLTFEWGVRKRYKLM